MLQWCTLSKWCQNLPAGHCVTVVKAVLAMSEPTCQALCCSGAGCLSNIGTYLPGTVLQWCRMFKQYQNLHAGHCVTVVKAVLAMSEPTCRALCYGGAGCLSNVGVYLPGTVFTVVKAVLAMSESTCQALCYSGKDCLRSVRTYLPGTCVAGVQTVSAMSEPTCAALYCRGAVCLSSVRTYLPELCYSGAGWFSGFGTYLQGTVLQWCRLFKQCQNLPAGYCVTGVQSV